MNKKIKICFDKEKCIGCGACVSVADDYWNFSNSDSEKVELLESIQGEAEIFEREGRVKDESRLAEAQDICPTGAIVVEIEETEGDAEQA